MMAPGPRRRSRRRGFTLLELLITLTVTTIGLMGLLALHVVVTKSNVLSSRSGEAVAVAQRSLEEYRNYTLLGLLAEFGASDLPIDASLDTVAGRAGTTFARRLIVEQMAASSSLVKLRVEVTWTDDGAAAGAEQGALDHRLALEMVRTAEEGL